MPGDGRSGQPFTAAQWRSALPRRSPAWPSAEVQGRADGPGLVPISGPDPGPGRLRQSDRPGLSSRRSPCAVTGDPLRRQDDQSPSGMHLRTEVPAPCRSGRPCRRQMRASGIRGHRTEERLGVRLPAWCEIYRTIAGLHLSRSNPRRVSREHPGSTGAQTDHRPPNGIAPLEFEIFLVDRTIAADAVSTARVDRLGSLLRHF